MIHNQTCVQMLLYQSYRKWSWMILALVTTSNDTYYLKQQPLYSQLPLLLWSSTLQLFLKIKQPIGGS